MRRERIAIGRELQRGEAEDLGAPRVVAGAALRRATGCCATCRAPLRPRSARPSAGASTASRCSSFHAYDANTQWSAPVFHRNRVSTLRPSNANSFQKRVPTGKSQWSRSRRVDGRAVGQPHPAALAGAVAPQRILRRERPVARVDRQRAGVRVEPGLGQQTRRHGAGAAVSAAPAPHQAARRRARQEQRACRGRAQAMRVVTRWRSLRADRSAAARGSSPAAATAGRPTAP